MTSLIDIVLRNSLVIDASIVIPLVLTSHDVADTTQLLWQEGKVRFIKPVYISDNKKCKQSNCNKNADTDFGYCTKCMKVNMKLITATEAKKTWKLKDEDLDKLNVYSEYKRHYRVTMRLFDTKEVAMSALVRYGFKSWQTPKLMKMTAKEKRTQQLHNLGLNPNDEIWKSCCMTFLKNGQGGIKGVQKLIHKYNNFMNAYMSIDDDDKQLIDMTSLRHDFVHYETTNDPLAYIKAILLVHKNKRERESNLRKALQEVGLDLRHDSRTCAEYIQGRSSKTLDQVIEIMQEMDYLYNYTPYEQIMNRLMKQVYENIRYLYGLLPRDEYKELIKEERHEASDRAKYMSVRGIKNLPSYMLKYRR